jgi:hypothetical protein
MLWVSTHLTFSGRMFPEWDRKLSPSAQIRLFIEAGYKWDYVWDQAVLKGQPFTRLSKGEEIRIPRPPADNGWMKRQLKKAYDETGEVKPQLTHGVANYRLSYAQGFVDVVTRRVDQMWLQRRTRENSAGDGVSLVLAKDSNAVLDYFNSLYPPGALSTQRGSRKIGTHSGARSRGAAAGSAVDFSGGQGGLSGAPRKEIG